VSQRRVDPFSRAAVADPGARACMGDNVFLIIQTSTSRPNRRVSNDIPGREDAFKWGRECRGFIRLTLTYIYTHVTQRPNSRHARTFQRRDRLAHAMPRDTSNAYRRIFRGNDHAPSNPFTLSTLPHPTLCVQGSLPHEHTWGDKSVGLHFL
jgi:hypothetical protein